MTLGAGARGTGIFARIRSNAAEVTRRARFVRIDTNALERFAQSLAGSDQPSDDLDPAHHFDGDASTALAFTLLLDAINFGSGWFPVLEKRAGMSGYRTIAAACRDHFERNGSPSASRLRNATASEMAEMLGQDLSNREVRALMEHFAQAWRDFGTWLGDGYEDSFEAVVSRAEGSAERLVGALATMPLYRDVARYDELDVPLYKRAQITVADLHLAFGDGPLGRFEDLDALTLFADNLVPHVLRCHGVLAYDEQLLARIERGELLEVGSREEVEIRAVAVEAVERLVLSLGSLGRPTTAHALDGLLWNAGQAPEIKAHPRHRARCTFY